MVLAILKRGKMHYLKGAYTDRRSATIKGLQLIKSKQISHFLVKIFRGKYELWVAK